MPAPSVLHPLGVGELLDAAIYIYRKSFVTLIGISTVYAVPFLLLQSAVFINASLGPSVGGNSAPADSGSSASTLSVNMVAYFISGLLNSIGAAFELGALAFAVSERHMGRRVTIGGAYCQALRRWKALFGYTVISELFSIAMSEIVNNPVMFTLLEPILGPSSALPPIGVPFLSGIGLPLLIPALIAIAYLRVCWSFTIPGIVIENLGAFRGISRSWRLAGGSFWRTSAILLIVRILVHVLTYIVDFTVIAVVSGSERLMFTALGASRTVTSVLLGPLLYAVITLLYYDLRVRREGYDLQLALEQLNQPAPAVSTEGRA